MITVYCYPVKLTIADLIRAKSKIKADFTVAFFIRTYTHVKLEIRLSVTYQITK